MAATKLKKKMGRPKVEIVAKQFEGLCAIHCTLHEVAAALRCSTRTIERWSRMYYGQTFGEISAVFQGHGKVSVRRRLFNEASNQNGDLRAAIFWAKNHLGMADKNDNGSGLMGEGEGPSRVIIEYAPDLEKEKEEEPIVE